jgi:hypothetical protein
MTRAEFSELLLSASNQALVFARTFVVNPLATDFRYHVLLNQSFDGHATMEERVFPEDEGREYASLTVGDATDILYRDGYCPEWVDLSVEAEGQGYTLLRALCCGRFSQDLASLYYSSNGNGPFGIKSPNLPFGYVEGTKFSIAKVDGESGMRAAATTLT